jgi:hypothetical protein
VIAVDGKTVRGARGGGSPAPHLVAALAHGSGAVLGQVAVSEKPPGSCCGSSTWTARSSRWTRCTPSTTPRTW